MTPVMISVVIALSALLSWATIRLILPLLRNHIMDVPNDRSSHTVPTPRSGGIGIVVGLIAGVGIALVLGGLLPHWTILLGMLIVSLMGLMDDNRSLSVLVRFPVQIGAAALVLVPAERLINFPLPHPLDVEIGMLALPLSFMWIVGMTNLYNFLDGIDGYTGTLGVICGVAIACADISGPLAPAGFAVAGGCMGFLFHNWHPARIFMGDVGSSALGFFFAALPFHLHAPANASMILLVGLSLWFFLSDGVYTFVKRALRGERVWEPHKEHLYQRLIMSGLRHDSVVIVIGLASLVIATATVLAITLPFSVAEMWGLIGFAFAAFGCFLSWTVRREKRGSS